MKTSINNNYHLDLNDMLSLEVNQAAKWVLLVRFFNLESDSKCDQKEQPFIAALSI